MKSAAIKGLEAILFLLWTCSAHAITRSLTYNGSTLSIARNTETVVSVHTVSKTLSTAVDYVITAEEGTAAMTATVDIANGQAAVIFRNIRPSVVISDYLKYIKINGGTASNGNNCRVEIYRHGSIVLPYGNNCQPLTIYKGIACAGESKTDFNVGTWYKDLGTWDNAIQSFTLRRGYMVTMANHADGTGYSHCFIANDGDITITLPQDMRQSVSFLRIFRWRWVSKKGLAGRGPKNHEGVPFDRQRYTWFYEWNASNYGFNNYDYVPMRHHETGYPSGSSTQKWQWPEWNDINALSDSHVLGMNEPDNNSGSEVYMTVSDLIQHHKAYLESGMRIGTFATCNPNASWVKDYVERCEALNYRVDFVATHYYEGGRSPAGCISRLKELYDATQLPVWCTEWNNGANWTTESGFSTDSLGWHTWGSDAGTNQKMNGVWLKDVLKRADQSGTTEWMERFAIYNDVEYSKRYVFYTDEGWETPGGAIVGAYRSDFAYKQTTDVWMNWQNQGTPSLSGGLSTDVQTINLLWTSPNTDWTKSVLVQEQTGTSVWTTRQTLGVSDATSRSTTLNASQCTGSHRFRIVNIDADGTERISNILNLSNTDSPNGFTRLTALPSDLGNYYFMFYTQEANDLCWTLRDGTKQTGHKAVQYAKPATLGTTLTQLWALESDGTAYALRNLSDTEYIITSPNSWNFRFDESTHLISNKARYTLTYNSDEDYWTMQNTDHANSYVGLWLDDKNFYDGAELAGNRTSDRADRLILYAIPRLDFNQVYLAEQGHHDANYLLRNQRFTWGTATASAQGSGNISYPREWTFRSTFDGWNDCFIGSGATLSNGSMTKFFNAWAGKFTYAELMQPLTALPNGIYRLSTELATTEDTDGNTTRTALYGNAGWGNIMRSYNITGQGANTFRPYDCYVLVTGHEMTVGVRSDGLWFKTSPLRLEYVCSEAEATQALVDRLDIGRELQTDAFTNGNKTMAGDVNGDKVVSVADLTALVNLLRGGDRTTPYRYSRLAADLDQDGSFTLSDLSELVKLILE